MRAGAESPANAANGFSGVAKLEKTRLNHTTSGFNLRIVFNRRTGVARLPNFQQRITLKPGSSELFMGVERIAVRVCCEFIISQFVGQNGQARRRDCAAVPAQYEMRTRSTGVRWGEMSQLGRFSSGPSQNKVMLT